MTLCMYCTVIVLIWSAHARLCVCMYAYVCVGVLTNDYGRSGGRGLDLALASSFVYLFVGFHRQS